MAKESSFKNMVISLSCICLVCAAILGCVYVATASPISEANIAKQNASIAAVCPEFDNTPFDEKFDVEGVTVYPAKLGGEIVGYAVEVAPSGFGGAINMMVGFTAEGIIYNTSVISCSETPGLGAKILDASSAPRVQVVGIDPSSVKLGVKKDGGDIDAITASTITSRAFLSGVEIAYEIFGKIQSSRVNENMNQEIDFVESPELVKDFNIEEE